jgi:hypothetical protein
MSSLHSSDFFFAEEYLEKLSKGIIHAGPDNPLKIAFYLDLICKLSNYPFLNYSDLKLKVILQKGLIYFSLDSRSFRFVFRIAKRFNKK